MTEVLSRSPLVAPATPKPAPAVRFPKPQEVMPTNRPLKICVVYGRTPLPMRRADQMTVAHLLAFLHARGHQVDFFYIDTGGEATAEDRAWIAEHTRLATAFPFG